MSNVNAVTFTIVVVLFLLVTLIGFAATRWRRAEDMMHLNEWGLGGRGFGTFVAWFLLGGDLYTAYTFIAVPAAVFGAGAVTGFFAVSYTIIVFPIAIIFLPRLWSIARTHNYVTPADFIRGRYGSRSLSLAIAFTGILALMPYIALQLVGIQAVLTVMGVGTSSANTFVKDLPLFIAFVVLAIFTFISGLRAPALIAFVKDTLVYLMIIVAVLYLPAKVGGWGHIFAAAEAHLKTVSPVTHKPTGVFIPTTGNSQLAFSTLALGSALALMVYPHSVTGVLSTKRRDIIKRNMALLPVYSIMLGFIALLGYVAVADKTTAANVKKANNAQLAVPYLFQHLFPSWFTGIAFAAIVIGALVPAAIMAIAAANLFTRNIFKEFFHPEASPRLQTRVSQWVVADRQAGRAAVRDRAAQDVLHQPAAARRHLDPADLPRPGRRPVHPLVPPLRPAGGLAGRDGLRHDRRVQGGDAHHLALGRVGEHHLGPHLLHRAVRDHPQPGGLGGPHPRLQGRQAARGHGRDQPAGVPGRPGRGPGRRSGRRRRRRRGSQSGRGLGRVL